MHKLFLLVPLSLLVIQSCRTSSSKLRNKLDNFEAIYLLQNGEETKISEESTVVTMDRDNFALQFFNRRYDSESGNLHSAQIAAFVDKEVWSKLTTGMLVSETSCFAPGTGMAASPKQGYRALTFNSEAHHYLYYEDGKSRRLKQLGKHQDQYLLQFKVTQLNVGDKVISMSDAEMNEFYLAILIDRNLDGRIEQGELKKLSVRLR